MSVLSGGVRHRKEPSLRSLLFFSLTGELALLIDEAVAGTGSSSSESGSGVGLISSKPVLGGREFCWPLCEPLV